jgi:uncharacterized surface protein with fasciclin (FAS1) repeats
MDVKTPTEETTMKRISIAILTLALAFATPSQAQNQDIVDVAAGNKDFSTLVAAVKAAGLVDTLKGKGPFTVFAPTDEAFKKLPVGTLDSLLKPESKAKLASILKYHVVPGSYDSTRLGKAKSKQFGLKSAQGSEVNVNLTNGVKVSGATVTQPDIKASNGVIHVIDTVILPKQVKAAMRTAEMKEKAAAKAAELKAKAAETAAESKAKTIEMKDRPKAAPGGATTATPAIKKP